MAKAGKKQKNNRVIITATDQAMQNMDKLADALGSKGFKVDEVMPMTGVITGSYDQDDMAALNNLDGVMSAEKEVVITLPPPDSELQ